MNEELIARLRSAGWFQGGSEFAESLIAALSAAEAEAERERDALNIVVSASQRAYEDLQRQLAAAREALRAIRSSLESNRIEGDAVRIARAALSDAPAPVSGEKQALERLGDECWSLVCKDYPIADTGDADVGYDVISHHQAKPHERREGFGRTPIEALRDAGLLSDAPAPVRPTPSQNTGPITSQNGGGGGEVTYFITSATAPAKGGDRD